MAQPDPTCRGSLYGADLYELFWCVIESKDECLLLGVTPLSDSSSMHFLLTGPRGEGRKVMGERDLLLAQPRLVGEDEGEGEKDKLGTGICIEGEKHCFPGTVDLVGEGLGEGDVLGEGKGPTPMVRGVMGSVFLDVCPWLGVLVASFESLKLKSSQL